MVSGEKHAAAHRKDLVNDLLHALVHRVHRLDRRGNDARVPDHVAVCKVQDHRVVFARLELFDCAIRHFVGAHLGL